MSKVMKLFCCVGAVALLFVAGSAFADYTISLNDPSFESWVAPDEYNESNPSWGSYSSALTGAWGKALGINFNPMDAEFAGTTDTEAGLSHGVLPDGGQVGMLAYGQEGDIDMRLNQTTGETIVAGRTYTLDFYAGNRLDAGSTFGWSGVTAKLVDGSGNVIGSQDFTTAPTPGTFSHLSFSATATNSHSGLLRVEFFSDVPTTSTYAHEFLDSVTLTATPEPSTVILLVSGLVGLLAYAWKKRK